MQTMVNIVALKANVNNHTVVDRNVKSHLQFSQKNRQPVLTMFLDSCRLV